MLRIHPLQVPVQQMLRRGEVSQLYESMILPTGPDGSISEIQPSMFPRHLNPLCFHDLLQVVLAQDLFFWQSLSSSVSAFW